MAIKLTGVILLKACDESLSVNPGFTLQVKQPGDGTRRYNPVMQRCSDLPDSQACQMGQTQKSKDA